MAFLRQLVEMGRAEDLDREIRRHVFKWLPGVPAEYTQLASEAVKKARAEGRGRVTIKSTKTDDDVFIIKFIPGNQDIDIDVKQEPMDEEEEQQSEETPSEVLPTASTSTAAPARQKKKEKVAPPEISQNIQHISIDLEEEEATVESSEEPAEIPIDNQAVVQALKSLQETTHQQALAYETLVNQVPKMTESEVREMIKELPTPVSAKLHPSVKDFLEREEDETIRYTIGAGIYYLESHLSQKAEVSKSKAKYPMPEKKSIAERFHLNYHKYVEISRGVAYKGGSQKE